IRLAMDSVLYARVESNFLLGHLELQLSGTPSATRDAIQITGRNGRNVNEIEEVLPMGTYNLMITQPVPFRYDAQFPHCSVYGFSLLISDAASDSRYDCSLNSLVPWDLNSMDGGSVGFGGPISSRGTLHLYGESFAMPRDRTDTIRMRLNQTSLVAI